MNYYTKLLPWENNRRLQKLAAFRALTTQYFDSSSANWMADKRIEEQEAKEARVDINRAMREIHDIIRCTGINPSIQYTPPPMVGGYIQNIDLVDNIFNLHPFRIAHTSLIDVIDQAIGVYERNRRAAQLRAINPLFYIGHAFAWVARLPFVFIGGVGFNRQRAEESVVGRVVKGIVYLITALASLLTVLHLLGYL
ncbi:MAG: hypothetical protein ACYCVY_11325 [Acidiferrobacteraceae bacterium]